MDLFDTEGVLSSTLIEASHNEKHDLVIANVQLGATEGLIDELDARFDFDSPGTGIMVLLPLEAAVHEPPEKREASGREAREELEDTLEEASVMDSRFLLLTVLSALVASFGLLMDDPTAIVGAMVIAPLLGPIIAFSFGVVTADGNMVRRGLIAEVIGLVLAVFAGTVIGALVRGLPITSSSAVALLTKPGLFNLALALAAGSAGALSVTTGLERALVGVMVAVALVPPASALGLGLGRMDRAVVGGAAIMLTTNMVSIALAGIVTFRLSGLMPGEWWKRGTASRSVRRVGAAAVGLLALVALVLVPGTTSSLKETRLTHELVQTIEAWSPDYLEIDELSLDLRQEAPLVNIQLRTTRPSSTVQVSGLYELVANVIPNPVVRLELNEVRLVELRRKTAGAPAAR